jgi:NDP-sugar pyrophosphorylase family protein
MTARLQTVPASHAGEVTGYVNAGGRGTRLNAVFAPDAKIGVTKALLQVGSPPLVLIEHQVNKLLSAGVRNVVVGVGDHLSVAQHITATYGDGRVQAIFSAEQLGNGGDLLRTVQEQSQLFGDTVVITNVDTILDWSETAALETHRSSNADLTISLTLNRGVPNEDAFYVSQEGRVLYSEESTRNVVEAHEVAQRTALRGSSTGAIVVNASFLSEIAWSPADGALSLYKEVVGSALVKGSLFAYNNGERFFLDVGTVKTWEQIQRSPELLEPYLHYADATAKEMTA